MDGLRDFLESSTIHGLTYISTTKSTLVRLIWIAIVIAGFSVAGMFIHSSFSSWAESPILTSIETFPISQAVFPKVVVCPPRGSNTALNHDLEKADNDTFDSDEREDIINLAVGVLQQNEYNEVLEDYIAETETLHNWYKGYLTLAIPFDIISRISKQGYMYDMTTYSTYGKARTQRFGEVFSAEK